MLRLVRSLLFNGINLGGAIPFLISLLLPLLPGNCKAELPPLKIRVIGEFNQKGLSRDIQILTDEISALGHIVEAVDFHRFKKKKPKDPAVEVADIQILIQDYSDSLISFGRKNYFIPNPEFCTVTLEQFRSVDLILARTHEVERIFMGCSLPVYYLGFISLDQKIKGSGKDFRKCLHVKGSSPMKGTSEIALGWHSSFPPITIIDHVGEYKKMPKNVLVIPYFLSDKQLKDLQNSSGIHLCPSKTEGFGHYLVEAMSTGAAVITVDAPPMNEYIADPDFLIKPVRVIKYRYAEVYSVSAEGIREAMFNVLKMDPLKLEAQGFLNRKKYEEMRENFRSRLKALLTLN